MTPPKLILPPFPGCICGKSDCVIPYGLCHCGCGQKTTVPKYGNISTKQVKGRPNKFIRNHSQGEGLRVLGDPTIFKVDGVDCCVLFLTKGMRTIINSRLYKKFSQFKYCVKPTRYPDKFYAVRRVNNKYVYLHREILEIPANDGRYVDHANGDMLDNRIENLRPATHSENVRNELKHKDNESGYKGVSRYCKWRTGPPKWGASIYYDGRNHWLGVFLSPEAAHNAYCEAAKKAFGEFYNGG